MMPRKPEEFSKKIDNYIGIDGRSIRKICKALRYDPGSFTKWKEGWLTPRNEVKLLTDFWNELHLPSEIKTEETKKKLFQLAGYKEVIVAEAQKENLPVNGNGKTDSRLGQDYLHFQVKEWQGHNQDKKMLLRDKQLFQAQEYLKNHQEQLEKSIQDFIIASTAQQKLESRKEKLKKRSIVIRVIFIVITLILFVTWLIVSLQEPKNISKEIAALPLTAPSIVDSKKPVNRNGDWMPVRRYFGAAKMVLVPAGSFTMGSTEEEIDAVLISCNEKGTYGVCQRQWFENEAPVSIQWFEEPFWIDETEVTRGAYEKCVVAGICTRTPSSAYSVAENEPVDNVKWHQAFTYCQWRGARLPTEAEWEYAARGPDGLQYPWGNEFDGSKLNYEGSPGFRTVAVGTYPSGASWVGALDMSGNVWEWTSSLHKDYPYNKNDGREIIEGKNEDNSTSERIELRGGSFRDSENGLRAVDRSGRLFKIASPDKFSIGFRCARS